MVRCNCQFVLVLVVYIHLLIPIIAIWSPKYMALSQRVQTLVHSWDWVDVLYSHLTQLFQVDTKPW